MRTKALVSAGSTSLRPPFFEQQVSIEALAELDKAETGKGLPVCRLSSRLALVSLVTAAGRSVSAWQTLQHSKARRDA